MKHLRYLALLSIFAMLSSLSVFARNKNQQSVDIPDTVRVGGAQLKPGNYKMEWQGTGPDVQVTFLRDGKTVVTVPATLKTNDDQVTQDDIVTGSENNTLQEIDFRRGKEAVVFQQSGM
jgi:virulence-associated protein VagC